MSISWRSTMWGNWRNATKITHSNQNDWVLTGLRVWVQKTFFVHLVMIYMCTNLCGFMSVWSWHRGSIFLKKGAIEPFNLHFSTSHRISNFSAGQQFFVSFRACLGCQKYILFGRRKKILQIQGLVSNLALITAKLPSVGGNCDLEGKVVVH